MNARKVLMRVGLGAAGVATALGGATLAEAAGTATTPPPVVPASAAPSPNMVSRGSVTANAPAGATPVVCDTKENNPHNSSHVGGTVNVVVTNSCNQTVYNVHIRAALYFNHVKVADTGSVPKGNVASTKTNAAVACKSGTYQGWGGASWTNPPNITPPTQGAFGWSNEVKITC